MAFYEMYKPEEYGRTFEIADGDYSVTVMSAAEKTTKNGKGMIEVSIKVSDNPVLYVERYVEGEYFNGNMTRFFDAFGINRGNFNFASWSGKRGRAHFNHKVEQYQDKQGAWKEVNKARMQYLIVPERDTFPEDIPYQPSPDTRPQPANFGMSAAEQAGAESAFSGNAGGNASGNAGAPQMKGGPATDGERKRIGELLMARYRDGSAVFSDEEKHTYSEYRKEKMTAAELITFIENALKNRFPDAPELHGGQNAMPIF